MRRKADARKNVPGAKRRSLENHDVRRRVSLLALTVILGAGQGLATGCKTTLPPEPTVSGPEPPQEKASGQKEEAPKSSVPTNPLRDAYFGEPHLHTAYSLDAYIFGNQLNDPYVAYRFARGEEVDFPAGGTKRITKPLDFAAVTDHAEALGEYELCTNPQSPVFEGETCSTMRAQDMKPFAEIFAGLADAEPKRVRDICGADGKRCLDAIKEPWSRVQDAAEQFNDPGKFTTFVAWEYSAQAPEGKSGMMHRNVIFRGKKVTDTVFSAFEGTGEELHAWLEKNCTGDCRVLTIPHNPNFYWGRLYWGKNSDGSEMTAEIRDRRARMDRLVEVMQIKGNSECQTGIGTADEECNFETVFQECQGDQKAGCSDYYSFVRNGLKEGLKYQAAGKSNPFGHGIIASTDNHNGTPGDTAEDKFRGHYADNDAAPEVRLGLKANPTAEAMGMAGEDDPTRLYNPGGLAGVWAESNTRESIWDALHRKETFGTSGTRTKVRMFGGFGFANDLHEQGDWVKVGYEKGVPQGGNLKKAPENVAPAFVLFAQRDPDSAPLAKIQVIKGWLEDGEPKERTYDAVCSDGAQPSPKTHRCPDNGATVDLETCTPSKDKGAAELSTTWVDPDFDSGQDAFYYARVIENPVCRWSMYDAKELGIDHPKKLPKTIRERAWSSPIWYRP